MFFFLCIVYLLYICVCCYILFSTCNIIMFCVLIMSIEDEFGIEISDEDFEGVKTVGDALDFLEKRI